MIIIDFCCDEDINFQYFSSTKTYTKALFLQTTWKLDLQWYLFKLQSEFLITNIIIKLPSDKFQLIDGIRPL